MTSSNARQPVGTAALNHQPHSANLALTPKQRDWLAFARTVDWSRVQGLAELGIPPMAAHPPLIPCPPVAGAPEVA